MGRKAFLQHGHCAPASNDHPCPHLRGPIYFLGFPAPSPHPCSPCPCYQGPGDVSCMGPVPGFLLRRSPTRGNRPPGVWETYIAPSSPHSRGQGQRQEQVTGGRLSPSLDNGFPIGNVASPDWPRVEERGTAPCSVCVCVGGVLQSRALARLCQGRRQWGQCLSETSAQPRCPHRPRILNFPPKTLSVGS